MELLRQEFVVDLFGIRSSFQQFIPEIKIPGDEISLYTFNLKHLKIGLSDI